MEWFTAVLIERCVCGGSEFEAVTRFGMDCGRCGKCGAVHQRVEMTPEELGDWYRTEYLQHIYTHTYEQDVKAARSRLRVYGDKVKGKVLDVGCGNGAFVDVCRESGREDVWGQEVSEKAGNGRIYGCRLDQAAFPTEYWDAVTVHDVVEHVVDIRGILEECRRMLKEDGWLMVEVPDFRIQRHWKKIEHLWCLTPGQFAGLLRECGLRISYFQKPVEGKVTFYCRRGEERRKSVLVPPGIGDSYWSVVKMPGLMRSLGVKSVDVYVAEGGDGRKRSLEWLRKIPWLAAKGYREHSIRDPIFREAYLQKGRFLYQNVAGCDYFLAFNGVMRFGADLDEIRPEWGSEWFPPLFESLEEKKKVGLFQEELGEYVVAYFVDHGMYKQWLREMRLTDIAEGLRALKAQGLEVVFMGAQWDVNGMHNQLARMVGGVDLSGKTTIDEMFSLLKGAKGVVGWPAGNTIMATVLRKPTLLFWNKYFQREFWRFTCPPESRGKWYVWESTQVNCRETIEGWMGAL